MAKEIISSDSAPAAIGPYSQAVRVGNFLYTSGQIPLDPATGKVVEGDIKVQAAQSCKNLLAVLEAAGMTPDNVIKTVCFIKNMNDFAAFNEVYAEYFGKAAPARSCVEVARLPKDVLCEVELVAYKD
ncbi:RidA family protein [Succinimonas amylolytica]|uniref:RidA family protein n=1 Tax=Succinimonas amylolytica TaxID=83769 RepID=UPI00037DED85|nr:RidA family protein [Succinimonas amylolytica]